MCRKHRRPVLITLAAGISRREDDGKMLYHDDKTIPDFLSSDTLQLWSSSLLRYCKLIVEPDKVSYLGWARLKLCWCRPCLEYLFDVESTWAFWKARGVRLVSSPGNSGSDNPNYRSEPSSPSLDLFQLSAWWFKPLRLSWKMFFEAKIFTKTCGSRSRRTEAQEVASLPESIDLLELVELFE